MPAARAWYRDLALAAFTVLGFALPPAAGVLFGLTLPLRGWPREALFTAVAFALASAGVIVVAKVYLRARAAGPERLRAAYEALVLAWLPAWGLVVNHAALDGRCVHRACDVEAHRAFAEPWVIAPALLHVAAALAFTLSRRRPGPLPPRVEAATLAALLVGVALHLALQVQLGAGFLVVGLVVAFPGLPVIAPLLTVALFAGELRDRLRRRGAEELTPAPGDATPFRDAPAGPPAAPISARWLRRALAWSPLLLGAYAALAALVTRRAAAGVLAFTETCDHALSQLPVQTLPGDCHYLCTVAARGHPWLVGPERLGVRGGEPIVVNRQLAVANAFEDLLHARWPRFGRACRRAYDRLALPVSRAIRRRLVADLVYLAMKPAERAFYAVLLALDPDDPEARIARMYRP